MKKHHQHEINRRHFIRQSACAALGISGLVDSLAHFAFMNSIMAQTTLADGYKAVVVIYLLGGNDSNNMLIPGMAHTEYNNYISGRGILAYRDPNDTDIENLKTLRLNKSLVANTEPSDPNQYCVNPNMSGVQSLFNQKRLSFVANVGTLSKPLTSQGDYKTVALPEQLFSHADQMAQWQASISNARSTNGWAGRVADVMRRTTDNQVHNPAVSMCISVAGSNKLQVGDDTQQYCISPSKGAIPLSYGSISQPGGAYNYNTNLPIRVAALTNLSGYVYNHLLEQAYVDVARKAKTYGDLVTSNLSGADNTGGIGVDINTGEARPGTLAAQIDASFPDEAGAPLDGLKGQLRQVARLLACKDNLINGGVKRQIFFCAVPGYDTHQNQKGAHDALMYELSQSLVCFDTALRSAALNLADKVVTLTQSDFTRTLSPNGTGLDTAGTDHGWGGHQIVMGGPVTGGQIFGTFPRLVLGSATSDSVDVNTTAEHGRGRWIPSTSVDQYMAVVASWFGISGANNLPGSNLDKVLPNLKSFNNPFFASAKLGFLPHTA